MLSAQTIATAFIAACRDELEAPKPGNVHIFAAGHGMDVGNFRTSAAAAAPCIAQAGASTGARIDAAMAATWAAVAKNTNLGIILLCAPLAAAAERGGPLPEGLRGVLDHLTINDAALAFRAIRLASPAGLGNSDAHDVRQEPTATLLEAMLAAAGHDRIAWNYAHGFDDVINSGQRVLAQARQLRMQVQASAWRPVLNLYLHFLSARPDSHIARKFGGELAREVQLEAAGFCQRAMSGQPDATLLPGLLALDARLKSAGLNPGTSADLTVAALFAERLIQGAQSA